MSNDYNAVINEIMPLVKDGDKSTPFIITRDSAYKDWQVCYPYPAENADSFFDSQKEHDPFAVMFTGADFSNGSFPFVYDTVLCARIRAELEHNAESGMYDGNSIEAFFEGMDEKEARALVSFFEDNISEFSPKLTDYLTTLDEPLAAVIEMCPFDLTTDYEGWEYHEELAQNALDHIEKEVNDRLRDWEEKPMMTAAHCIENTHGADFTGKLLIVKADALMPEYRDSESQLVKCTHGNGARPNAIGRSIFCKELASEKTVVYYRPEIEGIANYNTLPAWAKRKLAEQTAKKPTQKPKTPEKAPSLLDELEDAKAEAAARNTALKDKTQTKKRDGLEV